MNTKNHKPLRQQMGLSLVELMVSLVIGLILMAGVIQIFLNSRNTQVAHEESLRIQENVRFANHFIAKDLRSAGYLGCTSVTNHLEIKTLLNDGDSGLNLENFAPNVGLQGWSAENTKPGDELTLSDGAPQPTTSGWVTAGAGGAGLDTIQAMPGSDIFRIWSASNALSLDPVKENGADPWIEVTGQPNIAENQLILITDCHRILTARACDVESAKGNNSPRIRVNPGCGNKPPGGVKAEELLKDLVHPAEVLAINSYIYYVGKRGNNSTNRPALFRIPLSENGAADVANREELIEGVENMQVLYGIDTNGDREVDRDSSGTPVYVSAEDVPNWQQVVSVQVALLFSSADQVRTETDTNTYDLLGIQVSPPADHRLRRVMTTTVALRNRSL